MMDTATLQVQFPRCDDAAAKATVLFKEVTAAILEPETFKVALEEVAWRAEYRE